MEDYLRRLLEENRKARGATTDRFTRLADVLQRATPQDFSEVARQILDEATGEPNGESNSTTTTEPPAAGAGPGVSQPASPSGPGPAGPAAGPADTNPISWPASPTERRE